MYELNSEINDLRKQGYALQNYYVLLTYYFTRYCLQTIVECL